MEFLENGALVVAPCALEQRPRDGEPPDAVPADFERTGRAEGGRALATFPTDDPQGRG